MRAVRQQQVCILKMKMVALICLTCSENNFLGINDFIFLLSRLSPSLSLSLVPPVYLFLHLSISLSPCYPCNVLFIFVLLHNQRSHIRLSRIFSPTIHFNESRFNFVFPCSLEKYSVNTVCTMELNWTPFHLKGKKIIKTCLEWSMHMQTLNKLLIFIKITIFNLRQIYWINFDSRKLHGKKIALTHCWSPLHLSFYFDFDKNWGNQNFRLIFSAIRQ